jgi:hypothetical protein
MVRELDALAREAGLTLPWIEQLAADIFVGTFSAKFLAAAKIAAELLDGTLYARYYRIDYPAIARIDDLRLLGGDRGPSVSDTFDALCRERTGVAPARASVAHNGMVIEQAQILTTRNLATLVREVEVRPAASWVALAEQALRTAVREHDRRRAAAGWRQMVFFLSLTAEDEQRAFADRMAGPARRLAPELAALVDAAGPPFVGWRMAVPRANGNG